MNEDENTGPEGGPDQGACLPSQTPAPWWHVRVAAALIVVVAAAVYLSSFNGKFVLDDNFHIVRSRSIRRLWPIWEVVRNKNRPVVNLSLAVNYHLGRLKPWGYHAFNMIVHLAAALALFGVVRRTLLSERLRGRFDRAALALAAAAALIWAVHPLQTASVTYVIQRAESMMGMFYLLALYCAIRGFTATRPGPWYAAAVLCSVLGMGTKEVMVTAPAMILIYDRVFAGGSFRGIFRRRWGLYAGLASSWLVLLVRFWAHPGVQMTGFDMPVSGWAEYGVTQFGVILHYLRLSVWPHRLCLDPAWPPARTVGAILPQALGVTALLVATGVALWRKPALGFLGLWFFLILTPTSSVMPIADRMFEHRVYLSLAAVVVLFVVGGYALARRLPARMAPPAWWIGAAAAAVVAVTLGVLTVRRNRVYHDLVRIYRDVVDKAPHNPRAHRNLGVALTDRGVARNDPASIAEGVEHLRKAIELTEDRAKKADAYNNYGVALYGLSQTVKDGWKYEQQALEQYRKAIELNDKCADAHLNLAVILARRAGRAKRTRRPHRAAFRESLLHFERAMTLSPRSSRVHFELGTALAQMGDPGGALTSLMRACELKPTDPDIQHNLAQALWDTGRDGQAVAHFRETLRLRPGLLRAAHGLARALAMSSEQEIRNGPEAVRLARLVCEEAGAGAANPHHLDTLAAAYAEVGRFEEAILVVNRAIELASKAGARGLLTGLRARRELYSAAKPYHRPSRPSQTTPLP